MRRVVWLLVAIVVVVSVAAAVIVMRTTSSSSEHLSLADVQASLVRLSDMPAGTVRVTPSAAVTNPCTGNAFGPTLVKAQAAYFRPDGPVTLIESVVVYAKGAAKRTMNDTRVLSTCPDRHQTVAALGFPRLASDQVSYQAMTRMNPPLPPSYSDLIGLKVNDSAVLFVLAIHSSSAPNINGTEAFARKAYTRAKSKLGG